MRPRRVQVTLVVTVCAAVCLSGCQSLRRKFVRQKKKAAEEKFIPILEPIEYETSSVSPAERYDHHYQTYRVWERELMAGLERSETDKRLQFFMEQLTVNLESLSKWAPEEKRPQLEQVLTDYRRAADYFQQPAAFRNQSGFVSKLKRYERSMRQDFKTEKVFPPEKE